MAQKILLLLLASFAFAAKPLVAQQKKDADSQKKEWDVNAPDGDFGWKEVNFTVNEGTWRRGDCFANRYWLGSAAAIQSRRYEDTFYQ